MKLEDCCAEVVGLVPVYTDTGDGCRIICCRADGSVYSYCESHSVEAVKRRLARCYALHLADQARLLQRAYHRSPPLPFYFPDGRIFVPFKLRLAKIPGDGSYGYLEIKMIERLLPEGKGQCRIILLDGEVLPVFSQISTARLALYFGMEIQKHHFQPQPDPDRDLLEAFQVMRHYFISGGA
ncbi:MAG: hypothetical protein PHV56_04845 [Clostridia bacterium]|jgi:hypothetical protein|nr:hypothetical protein [Clostridia bacterium]